MAHLTLVSVSMFKYLTVGLEGEEVDGRLILCNKGNMLSKGNTHCFYGGLFKKFFYLLNLNYLYMYVRIYMFMYS